MIFHFFLAFTPPVGPAKMFDDCVAAHHRLNAASVNVSATSTAFGKSYQNRYVVKYQRPGQLLLRVIALKTISQPASDRVYFVNGSKLLALEPSSGEYLSRTTSATGTLEARSKELLGSLDDSVRFEINPDGLAQFFKPFGKLGGWRREKTTHGTALTRSVTGKSSVKFEFTAGSLLKAVLISSPESLLSWKFEYGLRPHDLALVVPPGSRKVEYFLAAKPATVRFANKKASKLWEAAIRAYSTLGSASMTIDRDGHRTEILFGGHRAAQRQDGLAWAYDGRILSLKKGGHFYRGPVPAYEIPAKVGENVDAFLQAWTFHKNPARTLSSQQMKARIAGTVVVRGVPCDLVEFTRPNLNVSVLVRRTDHLFARISSKTMESSGKRLSILDREVNYRKINKPISSSEFILNPAPGQKVEALPK